jgi:hypothetical protein
LLAIDTDCAMLVLLSPEHFTLENREVHYIIRALNEAGHKIPHDRLLPFLRAVKPLSDKYPHNYAYAAALLAYAHHPDPSAEQTLRNELDSSNKEVQRAAAEALAALFGLTDARQFVMDAEENHGFEHLSPPQQHYLAVFFYNAEVNNGGHSQYFVNSSGDHWKSALEGLKEIGAEERAGILQKATALFGAAGPSVDNDPRHRQLAAFSEEQDKAVDELDRKYYGCGENIEALLAQYTLKNREHFRAEE